MAAEEQQQPKEDYVKSTFKLPRRLVSELSVYGSEYKTNLEKVIIKACRQFLEEDKQQEE